MTWFTFSVEVNSRKHQAMFAQFWFREQPQPKPSRLPGNSSSCSTAWAQAQAGHCSAYEFMSWKNHWRGKGSSPCSKSSLPVLACFQTTSRVDGSKDQQFSPWRGILVMHHTVFWTAFPVCRQSSDSTTCLVRMERNMLRKKESQDSLKSAVANQKVTS